MLKRIGCCANGSETLRVLTQDRSQLVGKLDWVTKLWLLETFVREERIGWDDPWLASLDLEYHNVNPDRGLFLGLEAEGKAWRMTSERDITAGPVGRPLGYPWRLARVVCQAVSRSDQRDAVGTDSVWRRAASANT